MLILSDKRGREARKNKKPMLKTGEELQNKAAYRRKGALTYFEFILFI